MLPTSSQNIAQFGSEELENETWSARGVDIDSPQIVQSLHGAGTNTCYRKNLVVNGDIENANLTIHGNLLCKGSVSQSNLLVMGHLRIDGECRNSSLYSRGNSLIRILRSSDVFVEESLIIVRECSSSLVQVASAVHAYSAIMSGGSISAGDSITVYRVRSDLNGSCSMRVGNVFLTRRREFILRSRIHDARKDISIKNEIAQVHRSMQTEGSDNSILNAAIMRIEKELAGSIQNEEWSRTAFEAFSKHSSAGAQGFVAILGSVSKGSTISFAETSVQLDVEEREVRYSANAEKRIERLFATRS